MLHLILTIFTCGLWLPIWLIITLVSPRSGRWEPNLRGFVSEHPALTGFGALFAILGAMAARWKVVLCVAITVDVVAGLVALAVLLVRYVRRRRMEMAAMATRADDQHEALLRGDDQWGVFGQKPSPPVENRDAPTTAAPSLWTPARSVVVAGCAVSAGLVLFAALITVTARSADRSSAMPAPRTVYVRTPMAPPRQSMPATGR